MQMGWGIPADTGERRATGRVGQATREGNHVRYQPDTWPPSLPPQTIASPITLIWYKDAACEWNQHSTCELNHQNLTCQEDNERICVRFSRENHALEFVAEQEHDRLDALFGSVHVIPQEDVVRAGREAAHLEQSQKVVVLPVHIAADVDRASHLRSFGVCVCVFRQPTGVCVLLQKLKPYHSWGEGCHVAGCSGVT